MSQVEMLGDLEESVGYVLKQVAAALRAAMEAVLRPLDLTVAQYACMELLRQRPGLSNAELARGAFVTRQSMNLVLRGLQDRGLVIRPSAAPSGRALPSELTATGREQVQTASATVRHIEAQMLAPLTDNDQQRLRQSLAACADALADQRSTEGAG